MTNKRLYDDNYKNTLTAGISDSATTIPVSDASGLPALAGGDYLIATLSNGTDHENVKITAIAANNLTAVRGQEGTTNIAWLAGDYISINATKSSFNEKHDIVDGIVGLTGTKAQFDTAVTDGNIVYTDAIGASVQAYDADLTTLASAFTTASASGAASLKFAEDTDNGTNTVTLQGAASTADVTLTLQATTGTVYSTGGTDVAVADGGTGVSAASITAFNNITGFTAAGSTGTTSTNLVFSTSPALTTPSLGAATATSINFGGDTLNAYAQGQAWTPVPRGSGTAGTPTGTFAGRYNKIGRMVDCICRITFSALTGMVGDFIIGGLPFTVVNSTSARVAISVGFRTAWTNDFVIGGYASQNTTDILFFNSQLDNTPVVIGDLSATTQIYFRVLYEATT